MYRSKLLSAFVIVGGLLVVPAMAQTVRDTTVPPTPAAKPAATAPSTIAPAKPQDQQTLIDINSASKSELDALPGIGEARANAIIKGRPYRGKNELVDKKIISQNVYDQIKDRIVARQK